MNRTFRAFAALALACSVACASHDGHKTTVLESEPAWEANAPPPPAQPADPDPWPRVVSSDTATLRIYSPQVEQWSGNQIVFRCAVSATPNGGGAPAYGVLWAKAQTQVNRELRQVTLENTALTRTSFPTLADNGASYVNALRTQVPTSAKTVALDRIEASLAASGAAPAQGVKVQNTVPKIIVSYSPAILVPIAGKPVIQAVPGQGVERVLNTRAAILRVSGSSTFYLHVYDGWLSAATLDGPWSQAEMPPAAVTQTATLLASQGAVDLLDGRGAQPPPTLANGVPAIYTSQVPTELVVFKGQPELTPIGNTGLLFATNTTSDVLIDDANDDYYVLLSGRWFRAAQLTGPWTFVPNAQLPTKFAEIPTSSPAARVLAAVAGTPQAKEAAIENGIPHTATISLSNPPQFTQSYDGPMKLVAIPGTSLQYVPNSPVPVIRAGANEWYALQAGVWFKAPTATGPWTIATAVPAAIYRIPPSSPLHYVTYVQVYGATPDYVYTGYTPGYLGTVVAPDGVVVYGTGYDYQPWIGSDYYAAPATWGVEAVPVYNPAIGYGYGFALGMTTAAMAESWATPYYYSGVYHGAPCCGSTQGNVYGPYGGRVQYAGNTQWHDNSGGYGVNSSGTYTNEVTGQKGTYTTNQNYNPSTNTSKDSLSHTSDTAAGGTRTVKDTDSYNWNNGRYSESRDASGTTAGGASYSHSADVSYGGGQPTSVDRSTSVTTQSGQTYSTGTGDRGNNLYAGSDGNVYQRGGDGGWQQAGANGWQNSAGNNSWADREEQGRMQSQNSFGNFSRGNFGGQSGGFGGFGGGGGLGGGGGWGDHFGGGGFGGRFGGGGGFGGGGFRGGGRR
jgi:hypothetical protein